MEHGICDMHGHFLPGMDDGCKTPEESVQVLKSSYEQGVRRMFATPHYYPVEPVGEFLRRRDAAWNRLQGQLEKEPDACVPRICLGAEVAFRPGLSYEEDLRKLCDVPVLGVIPDYDVDYKKGGYEAHKAAEDEMVVKVV